MAKRKKSDALTPRRSKRLKVKNGEVVEHSDIESLRVVESIEVEPKQPPLLALPPELRNRIYEYALKEPGQIEATEDFIEPGLLAVNRQIRHETRTLFYATNRFSVTVVDCDLKPFYNLIRTFSATDARCKVFFLGEPNWSNVLAWCRGVYEDDLAPMGPEGGFSRPPASTKGRPLIMADVVEIATTTAGAFPPGQWDTLAASLMALRYTIGITDPEWLED